MTCILLFFLEIETMQRSLIASKITRALLCMTPALPCYTPPTPNAPVPHVEIIKAEGDCGALAPVLAPQEESAVRMGGFSVRFPGLDVETAESLPRARKLCLVRLEIKPPYKFAVTLNHFEIRGLAAIAQGARANVSARYFAHGGVGVDYFKSFVGDGATPSPVEFTGRSVGDIQTLPCGAAIQMNILVDLTVRASGDSSTASGESSHLVVKEIVVPRLFVGCPEP